MTHRHLTPTRLGLALAVTVGAVFGAVFGQPGSGRAAANAVPNNTQPPTISGTPAVGSTLTADPGTWDGSPTSYSYTWNLCDDSGKNCAAIDKATAQAYTVTSADVGKTLSVTVAAVNADGTGTATSNPTTVVPPEGCPAGTGTVQIADLSPPARLSIDRGSMSPNVVTPSTTSINLTFTVTACGGRPVQGASVFATAIPYNQFAATSGTTAADGTVTLSEGQLRGFPASRHQHLLAVFARAAQPNTPLLGGISTRRVVAFHARAH